MPSTTYNIAVVGPADTISGFRALGVDVFDAHTADEAREHIIAIRRMTSGEGEQNKPYAVVLVVDSLLAGLSDDDYKRLTTGALPALLAIPSITSDTEASTRKLRELAEKAIGSDILS